MSGMRGTLENRISLDLETAGIQHRLSARQGDSLIRKIVVGLTLGGKKYVPSGVQLAQFYALLADGSTVSADGVIRPDGAVEFVPGSGFFALGGPIIVRLVLRDGDGAELYSPAFAIDAEYCFAAGAPAAPAEEYSRIEELLLRTLEAQKNCEATAEEIRNGDYSTPLSDEAPLMDGESSPGTAESAARADHTHPTDTARMPSIDQMTSVTTPVNGDYIPVYISADKTMKKILFGRMKVLFKDSLTAESWTFVLKDGSTVEKEVMVK